MFSLLKYLPLVGMFRDVTDKVRADGVAKRPWFLQRSTLGAIGALVSGVLLVIYGIKIDTPQQAQLVDLVITGVAAGSTLYSMILGIYGVGKPGKDKTDDIAGIRG